MSIRKRRTRRTTKETFACTTRVGRGRAIGFTLIELMIVVAIIAVLIAILLPSLARAREMAKITKCAANMRSAAMGVVYYGHEFQDRLPVDVVWAESVRPFLRRLTTSEKFKGTDVHGGGGIDQVVKFYVCPSDPVRAFTSKPEQIVSNDSAGSRRRGGSGGGTAGQVVTVQANYRVSYAINSFLTQQFADTAAAKRGTNYTLASDPNRVRKSAELQRTGDVVMLTESGNDNVWQEEQLRWDFDPDEDPSGGPERIEVHHKTGNNFMFADVHLEYRRVLNHSSDPQKGVPRFPFHWLPLRDVEGGDNGTRRRNR